MEPHSRAGMATFGLTVAASTASRWAGCNGGVGFGALASSCLARHAVPLDVPLDVTRDC